MLELYVGMTLLGLGWILNQNRPVAMNPKKQLSPSDMNSARTPYDSTFSATVRQIEEKKADEVYQAAQKPNSTTISKNHKLMQDSQLTGGKVEFSHNNMQPFLRKGVTQNTNIESYLTSKFESFTGSDPFYKPKQERSAIFDPTKNLGNVCGTPIQTDTFQDRMVAPLVQNNVLPFQQVRVGPGMGQGYTATPKGGLQQFEVQDYARPKTVDELRVGSNPKVTYDGRVVDGQKGRNMGKIGKVNKNRVDTFYKQGPERYLKTTGAWLRDKQRPQTEAKETARQTSSREYAGAAYQNVGDQKRAAVRDPHRNQLAPFENANASLGYMLNPGKQDYGKASIQVYANERDITTTRTRTGNITSIVKALIAPIEDLVKISKKEYLTEHPRSFGSVQPAMPEKMSVYDPNDVMRTTLKETMLNESQKVNLAGPIKLTVYDPNNLPPTTLKETLLHDSESLNFRPAAPSKITVYDPNDVLRTTLKETLLHNADMPMIKGDRSMGVVYDPKVKARTTGRETLEDPDDGMNLSSIRKNQTVYDPNDVTRTTLKETMIDAVREAGNVYNPEMVAGGYENEEFDAPTTQRELQHDEYMGNPNQPEGDAYQIIDATPKETQKECLVDIEYYGNAADQQSKGTMSYEDAYNSIVNELREEVLQGREPTRTGQKVSAGRDHVAQFDMNRKIECDVVAPREFNNADRITNNEPDITKIGSITRRPNMYDIDDRLDEDLLQAFKDNPFTQSLNSSA